VNAPDPRPIRIGLADDSRTQREGFELLLRSQPDLTVVARAGDGAGALAIARREPIDVLLMAIRMPRVNGLLAAERIAEDERVRAHGAPPRIILLAELDLDEHVPAAAAAGVYAVVYKDIEPEALFETIRGAAVADVG